jgi:hypothetical protein
VILTDFLSIGLALRMVNVRKSRPLCSSGWSAGVCEHFEHPEQLKLDIDQRNPVRSLVLLLAVDYPGVAALLLSSVKPAIVEFRLCAGIVACTLSLLLGGQSIVQKSGVHTHNNNF